MRLRLIDIRHERLDKLLAVLEESAPWLTLAGWPEADVAQLDRHGTLIESIREEYVLAETLERSGFRLHITDDNQWEVR